MKYVKVEWPEIQDYMNNPEYNIECYFDPQKNCWFVPENWEPDNLEDIMGMKKIEYFVRCIKDKNYQLWRHRYLKKQFAPLWEKLNPEYDNIEEIIKTHKYKYDTYPDNDFFHEIIEYTVEIKKVTIITEYL